MTTPTHQEQNCWSCGEHFHDLHFCGSCGKIQPLGPEQDDYYRFLGCPLIMGIPWEQLRDRFYELSRKFHPDYFQNQTEQEREYSLQRSAALTRAYRTLRDPLTRAQHMIDQSGLNLNEQLARHQAPPDLLMEVMELQEGVHDLATIADPLLQAQAKEKVLSARSELNDRLHAIHQEVEEQFDLWDAQPNQRRPIAEHILALISTQSYLTRTLTTIDHHLD